MKMRNKKYSINLGISFLVDSNDPYGEDLTEQELAEAIANRISAGDLRDAVEFYDAVERNDYDG